MKTKKEPRDGWATVCGAKKTRKFKADYSLHSAQGRELIDHKVCHAGACPPVSTGGGAWLKSILTSTRKAGSLHVLKQRRCVDLHLKSGLFLFVSDNRICRECRGVREAPGAVFGFRNTHGIFYWRNPS